MIQRLHRLKNKRGYTIMEMIIVIAILAIMTGTITANTSSRLNRIREANSTAQDFYTVIQTEFTRFQMFDGPLTMSLSKKYSESPDVGVGDDKYGGLMWFPRAGGNYPMVNDSETMKKVGVEHDEAMKWRKEALPIDAGLTIEVHVVNNKIQTVDWDYTTAGLFAKAPDYSPTDDPDTLRASRTELAAVLQLELDRKMDYKDGYYYARIWYANDTARVNGVGDGGATSAEMRATPVKVVWAAYCRRQFSDAQTYSFRKAYTSNVGEIVGVVGGKMNTGAYLGDTGTNFVDAEDE